MFHDIPAEVLDRMHEPERRDAEDRPDGASRLERLRQVTPETGHFLTLWAATAPDGLRVEIGTSTGYSALCSSSPTGPRGSLAPCTTQSVRGMASMGAIALGEEEL